MCLYLQTKMRIGRSFKAKKRRDQSENLIQTKTILVKICSKSYHVAGKIRSREEKKLFSLRMRIRTISVDKTQLISNSKIHRLELKFWDDN